MATQGNVLSYAALPTNIWTQVAVSFNPTGNVYIYYNGILKASAVTGDIGYQGSTAKISIGCQDGAYNCFNGQVDDARLYNRVLSVAEIQELYNAGK